MDQDINIFPEKGGDTSLRITILDEKKTDRQVMQTLVLLMPHLKIAGINSSLIAFSSGCSLADMFGIFVMVYVNRC